VGDVARILASYSAAAAPAGRNGTRRRERRGTVLVGLIIATASCHIIFSGDPRGRWHRAARMGGSGGRRAAGYDGYRVEEAEHVGC